MRRLDACPALLAARSNAVRAALRRADDYIYGQAGKDLVNGGPGNDYVYGQTGNDIVHGVLPSPPSKE